MRSRRSAGSIDVAESTVLAVGSAHHGGRV
jgi:hypothetical protein